MKPHERIYVAVDTNDASKALRIAVDLAGRVGGFKIGLELITNTLIQVVTMDREHAHGLLGDFREFIRLVGHDAFWDGKFDDIPNTIKGAVQALAPLSPKLFNVHATAGSTAMQAAVKDRGKSKALAVTVLTSLDGPGLQEIGYTAKMNPAELVYKLAALAASCDMDGVVCSPREIRIVREAVSDPNFLIVTPGIRKIDAPEDDQKRTMTPAQAIEAGANYLVIGRPITADPNPAAAAERIAEEIDSVVV